jgi:transposase
VDTLIRDLLDPQEAGRAPMVVKDWSDEFKADAVALYESAPGARCKSIAADLGINRTTLRERVLRRRGRRGVGVATLSAGGTPAARAGQTTSSADPGERIRQLEARVAELEARSHWTSSPGS